MTRVLSRAWAMHALGIAVAATLALLGCGGDGGPGRFVVTVELTTLARPAADFDEVITTLASETGAAPEQMAGRVSAGEDYAGGLPVAVFVDVEAGQYSVTVSLLLEDDVMFEETLDVRVFEDTTVTANLTLTCDPFESACGDGRDDDCDGLEDCEDPDCLAQRCSTNCIADGVCVDDGTCEAAELVDCDDTNPCTDDFCDADVGCQNEPNAISCDDSDVCTKNDVCSEGACVGDELTCDDGNACTTDACDPVNGCSHENNTASCDDGSWCNGPDVCSDGICSGHPNPPCGEDGLCNELKMECVPCDVAADCGEVTRGEWTSCDYEGTCDESASRSREVNTPRCEDKRCVTEKTIQTEMCARDQGGETCGPTSTTNYGACGGFSNPCDATGTQSRTVTVQVCRAGSCESESSKESRSCKRSVPGQGKPCSSDIRKRCCGGKCVNTTNDPNNCGLCGIKCPSGKCAPAAYKKLGACVSSGSSSSCPSGFGYYYWAACPADDGKCDCNGDSCSRYGGRCSESYSVDLLDVCYYPGMESYINVRTCN